MGSRKELPGVSVLKSAACARRIHCLQKRMYAAQPGSDAVGCGTTVMAQALCVSSVPPSINPDPIYIETEAAGYLRISLPTLRRKRNAGTGPKYKQDGHIIRYRRSWLDAWLNDQPVQAE